MPLPLAAEEEEGEERNAFAFPFGVGLSAEERKTRYSRNDVALEAPLDDFRASPIERLSLSSNSSRIEWEPMLSALCGQSHQVRWGEEST